MLFVVAVGQTPCRESIGNHEDIARFAMAGVDMSPDSHIYEGHSAQSLLTGCVVPCLRRANLATIEQQSRGNSKVNDRGPQSSLHAHTSYYHEKSLTGVVTGGFTSHFIEGKGGELLEIAVSSGDTERVRLGVPLLLAAKHGFVEIVGVMIDDDSVNAGKRSERGTRALACIDRIPNYDSSLNA
jgi:hypothetical protein